MQRSGILIRAVVLMNGLATVAGAQMHAGLSNPPEIDYANIFNTQYSYIGIPVGDRAYVYAPPPSKQLSGWRLVDSIVLPEGTIAMDGNIGKSIFLTKEAVLFKEYDQYDTLRFSSGLPPIDPRVWIRTPHSTQTDSHFLSGEKSLCYYREYDENQKRFEWQVSDQLNPYMFKENRTQPVLTDKDDFYKLYTFISGGGREYLAALFKDQIAFFRYPLVFDTLLKEEIIDPSKLTFPLPQGTLTAFIYDYKYLAIVSNEQISFYDFDKGKREWLPDNRIPPLRFTELYKEKK